MQKAGYTKHLVLLSVSVVTQATQNDADVVKPKWSINFYFCPWYVAMDIKTCARYELREQRDSELQLRERKEESVKEN